MLDNNMILKLSGYLTILGGFPMLVMLFYISLTKLPWWAFVPLVPLFLLGILLLISIARDANA